jgi:hypothetical protein
MRSTLDSTRPTRSTRSHVFGSVLFGIGWGISDAWPGPIAAQLGAGRALALAESPIPAVQGADVL